jgi:hypothetical protein
LNYETFFASGRYDIDDWNGNGVLEARIADVYVRATDGSLLSNDGLIHVFIEDVPEAPNTPTFSLYINKINESVPGAASTADALIARFELSDPDGSVPELFFTSNPNNWFKIVGNEVRVNDGVNFTSAWNRANGMVHDDDRDGLMESFAATISVAVRDSTRTPEGVLVPKESASVSFGLLIEDVNEKPNPIYVEAQNFFPETQGEETHSDKLIARFSTSDPDGPPAQLYIRGGNDMSWFTTIGGHIAFAPGVNFTAGWLHTYLGSYGTDAGYYYDNNGNGLLEARVATLTVYSKDARGQESGDFTYKVFIEDSNEAPTITTTSLSVREDILGFGEGVVGTLASTDPDPSGVFRNPTLAIVGGAPAGLFSLSGNNLMLQGALNYEATPAYNLTVSITDGGGLSSTRNVTVNVDDVNEAAEPYLVDGRWSARSATYYFTPNDPDDASGFVVTGAGSDNGNWQVSAGYDAASNRIWIRAYDPWVEYNQYSYGTLSATVTDRYGGGVSKTFSYYAHVDGPETGPEGHIPPIVIDLDGDGIELVSLAASTIKYDMDRDGLKDRTGWVAADDGFLVLDRNGNGIIDDAGEFSFKNDLTGAVSDLEGLRAFDSNGDGLFGSADRRFAEFRIWQDKNQDGISQATELSTLLERNIRSIRLELDETGAVPDGATDNVIFATSEFTRANGTTGDIGDVFLAFESAADADSKGKLKKGKKVKFAGIDPTQSLPEKLKKKVMQAVLPLGVTTGTSTNAASVSAQAAAASNPASETAPIDLPLTNRNPAAGASQPGGRADNATETPA